MQINTFPLILEDSFMISSKVKHFIFKYGLSSPFCYIPGQFISIHFEHQDKQLKRSYSIANSPSQENRIEFAAGFLSMGSAAGIFFTGTASASGTGNTIGIYFTFSGKN